MEVLKEQVVKEPKGFIRIVQFFLALFALYSTSSFATHTAFTVNCPEQEPVTIKYPVSYPFDFQNTEILVNRTCERAEDAISYKFPMDFSSSPQFYVTTSVLSLLYSAGALAGYSFAYQRYQENALIPVLDLVGSSIMSIFWIAGTTAWSAGVSDIKYYVSPDSLKEHIAICKETQNVCITSFSGKWNGLSISIIFGFGCIIVWCASIWFVYKHTQFFKQQQLLMQQQFSADGVQQQPISDPNQQIPAGTNPFGDFNPIGQQVPPVSTNPYVQQNY